MTNSVYPIQRWEGVLLSGSLHPQPSLYIQPDTYLTDLMQHSLSTGKEISIKISGTNSIYDNSISYATIQPSSITSGFRPNFQATTGWVVIIPKMNWQSYPIQLGTVEILGADVSSPESAEHMFVPSETLKEAYHPTTRTPNEAMCAQHMCSFILNILLLYYFFKILSLILCEKSRI